MLLTAGNRIGATPAWLSPERRRLFTRESRRGFATVVEQAIRSEVPLLVIAGGLFATSEPALDDLRYVTRWLRRLQQHDISVVALDDTAPHADDHQVSGAQFLADLGLLHPLLASSGDALVLEAGDLRIGLSADPQFAPSVAERRRLGLFMLVTDDAADAEFAASGSTPADLVVLGDTPAAEQRAWAHSVLIRPGWTSPANGATEVEPGFTALRIDSNGGLKAQFVPDHDARPVLVRVAPDELNGHDPATVLHDRMRPLLGDAAFVSLRLEGRFSREVWHRSRIGQLISQAAAAGTLLDVDLTGFGLTSTRPTDDRGASFQVELRRAADRLSAASAPEEEPSIDDARSLIAAALARPRPLEPVEPIDPIEPIEPIEPMT